MWTAGKGKERLFALCPVRDRVRSGRRPVSSSYSWLLSLLVGLVPDAIVMLSLELADV